MEAVLLARFKALIFWVVIPLIIGGLILFYFFRSGSLSQQDIHDLFSRRVTVIERSIDDYVNRQLSRSQRIFDLYRNKELRDGDLNEREAIFEESDGVIGKYTGNIYFFKIESLLESEWTLINKNQDIYFLRRFPQNTYYINFFLNTRDNFILLGLLYHSSAFELKYFSNPLDLKEEEVQYNRSYQQYLYQRVLKHLQKRFLLKQVFSQKYFEAFYTRRKKVAILTFFAVLFFYLFLMIQKKRSLPSRFGQLLLLWATIGCMSTLLSLAVERNLYLPAGNLVFSHVHQVLALVLCTFLALYLFRDFLRFPMPLLRLVLANLVLLWVCHWVQQILNGVSFAFSDFVFQNHYLVLLLALVILFLFPLLVLDSNGLKLPTKKILLALLVQAGFCAFYLRLAQPAMAVGIGFSFCFVLLFFLDRHHWMFFMRLALIAFSVNFFLSYHTLLEKKDFIRENLKMIFSSQNHYAMLVAREIVYEINSRTKPPFSDLFGPAGEGELKSIWNATLAAKEMIPSGIFVISEKGELIHSFSDQPFIKVNKKTRFPFWHEEEVEAELYGKRMNLALASISVFQGGRFLGDIMVQVVNSPELILRNQDQTSIFTIDQKIRDSGISYLKCNQEHQILQNPANINIENLAALMEKDDQWVRFAYMGISYRGYVFRQNENLIVIFFPEPTLFKRISEWIKVFLFVLLLYMLFHVRRLKGFNFQFYFASFSVRVFFILILIALLTAAVFSVFSLNFHFPSLERQLVQAVYEKGRIAQDLIQNLISEKGDINQFDVFMISKILDNNLMLYENGELQYSSDKRKIILSQIPLYLPSFVNEYLKENAQLFDTKQRKESVHLYSKISPHYVLTIEFFYNIADQARAKKYYVDFIITLFFFLILIGIASALFFRNKILAPIRALNRGMAEVEKGNLVPLPRIPVEIELQSLYLGFNSMIEGIKEQKKSILELARMKTLIQLSRRLAHEIKNPLTPIKLSAEQINQSLKDKSRNHEGLIEKSVHYIIEETEHLRKVAMGFLDLSKLETLEFQRFELKELIQQEISNLQLFYPQIHFSSKLPDRQVPVRADRTKIKQAIGNILNNAVDACENIVRKRDEDRKDPRWQRSLAIELELLEEEKQVEIVIRDNGIGMKKSDQDLLFAENYSTKETGTGLGLIIVKRIMELHKGRLEIQSRENEETTVTMRFVKDVSEA